MRSETAWRAEVEGAAALPRAYLIYLFRRLLDSLRGAQASPDDQGWAAAILEPAELGLWHGLSAFDQHHAVRVARAVERRLAGTEHAGDTRWLAAALLHDVGKSQAGLGPGGRAVADVVGRLVPLATARRWAAASGGLLRRVGLHLTHGSAGAAAIRASGGREAAAAWAESHQALPCPDVAGIPPAVAQALSDADLH